MKRIGGLLIDRKADFGIMLEKYWALGLLENLLKDISGVHNVARIFNLGWGRDILYFSVHGVSYIALNCEGGSSAASGVERLARTGVKSIVRVGSCGALQSKIKLGTVIVTMAAIRDDGVSEKYLPIDVPACANFYNLTEYSLCLQGKGFRHKPELPTPPMLVFGKMQRHSYHSQKYIMLLILTWKARRYC